jgi:hypothetical protein
LRRTLVSTAIAPAPFNGGKLETDRVRVRVRVKVTGV